jgi:hypothetical protein
VAPHEQTRLLPVDAAGVPLGSPSAEDALFDARPLIGLAGSEMLVAEPGEGEGAEAGERERLAVFECAR